MMRGGIDCSALITKGPSLLDVRYTGTFRQDNAANVCLFLASVLVYVVENMEKSRKTQTHLSEHPQLSEKQGYQRHRFR